MRFSALYASLSLFGYRTIETVYQSSKEFDDLSRPGAVVSNLNWRAAKGRRPRNAAEVARIYSYLWDEYIAEKPHLLGILIASSGLSDKFGQKGHQCQATELWRIRGQALARRL